MENSILLKVVFCAFLFSSTIGNALTIKEAEEKANQVCAACHGKDGVNGVLPSYPIIAGQYSDYLNQALNVTLEAPLEVAIANSSNLQNWTPNKGWIERLVSGENRIKLLDSIFSTAMGIKMDSEVSLEASQNEEFNQSINTLQGAISGITAFHLEMQKIPYFEFINATLPSKEQDQEGNYIDIASEERLAKSDIITISFIKH